MVDRAVKRKRYAVVVTTYGEVEAVTVKNLWPSSRKILKVVTRQIVKIPAAISALSFKRNIVDEKIRGGAAAQAVRHVIYEKLSAQIF